VSVALGGPADTRHRDEVQVGPRRIMVGAFVGAGAARQAARIDFRRMATRIAMETNA